MNDYIIAVDRDGQPYIAHAWGQRGANANHKYIAKIGEGAKARYFYTQEQLRAFQQGARQGAQNAANKAKEKAGINARQNLQDAKQAVRRAASMTKESRERHGSEDAMTKSMSKLLRNRESQQARAETAYKKTPFGKTETTVKNAKQKVKDTVQQLEDKRKEIQNKHTTIEKGSHTAEEWKNSEKGQKYMKNVSTSEGGHKLNKSQFSEYKKGDSDFDDKNFAEKNRVGDSDFFMAKRPDGSTVILEEDMKWIIPKGVDPNSPAIKAALTKEYKADSNDEWVKQVTEAIDDALVKSNKKI